MSASSLISVRSMPAFTLRVRTARRPRVHPGADAGQPVKAPGSAGFLLAPQTTFQSCVHFSAERRGIPRKCHSRPVESNSDPRLISRTAKGLPPVATIPAEEVTQMANAPGCAREALDMVRAGLGYLAAADTARLATATQAECLRELEQAEAVITAARAYILSGFTAAQGYADDAAYSVRAWLMHKTGITRGAAAARTAWAKRAE